MQGIREERYLVCATHCPRFVLFLNGWYPRTRRTSHAQCFPAKQLSKRPSYKRKLSACGLCNLRKVRMLSARLKGTLIFTLVIIDGCRLHTMYLHFKSNSGTNSCWNNAQLGIRLQMGVTVISRMVRRYRADCAMLSRMKKVQLTLLFPPRYENHHVWVGFYRRFGRRHFKFLQLLDPCIQRADVSRILCGLRAATA